MLAWSHLQKLCTTRFRPTHWGDFPSAVFRVLSETYAISLSESPCTALGDQSFWNVSPVTWTPNLIVGVIPDFSLCTDPLFPSGKTGVGRGCAHRLPDFKAQDSGFHKPAKISWIPKSGLPYTGAITFISQPCLFLIWKIVVNLPEGCPPKALKICCELLVRFNSICLIILKGNLLLIFLLSIADFLGACVAKPWSETKNVNLVPRSHSVLPLSLGRGRSGYQIRRTSPWGRYPGVNKGRDQGSS